jgi:hypothetical protein
MFDKYYSEKRTNFMFNFFKFINPLKIQLVPLRYSRRIKCMIKSSFFKTHFNIIDAYRYIPFQATL